MLAQVNLNHEFAVSQLHLEEARYFARQQRLAEEALGAEQAKKADARRFHRMYQLRAILFRLAPRLAARMVL